MKTILVILSAYLLGSIPTGLWLTCALTGKDIRTLGDGNTGARNVRRVLGSRAGWLVGAVDILKGMLAVLLAVIAELPFDQQMLAGGAAILGHDFPVFARFRGGQGFAATTGVFLALFPLPTPPGAPVYLVLYLLFHNSDLAASAGMGLLALLKLLDGSSWLVLFFIVGVLLFIPFKQRLDKPRRVRIGENLHHGAS